ncbi:MAG: hypothetical protein ABI175_05210 [Polyangiales bacterium]
MKLFLVAAMFVGFCALAPSAAEARGLVIINTGDDVMEIGDVKAEARAEVEAATEPGVKVGVRYSRFGIFWIDFFRWDTTFVLFHGNTFWEVPEADLAEVSAVPLKKPFTASVPPGLIGLGAIIIIFIAVKLIGRKKNDEGAVAAPGTAPPADAG